MGFWLTLQTAWKGLLSHRMRTLLTMSGVIVGVAALIATMAVGRGSRDSVDSKLEAMGRNAIYVWPQWRPIEGKSGRRKIFRLTLDDWQAVAALPQVKYAAPVDWERQQVVSPHADTTTRVMGISSAFLDVFHWKLEKGRRFTDEEAANGATVVLLGQTVAFKLFGKASPIDQTVRIARTTCKIVGVMESVSSDEGMASDDCVLMPVSTAVMRISNSRNIDALVVEPKELAQMDSVCEQVILLLGARNHCTSPDEAHKAYETQTSQQMLKASVETSRTFALLIFLTASLSLLVGGIGIMNTMMMAVLERTREIGVRSALGARPRDILRLFLTEALMLTTIGGLLGVAIGTGISMELAQWVQWPPVISFGAILIGLGCATLVGLIAGVVPAWRAARLEPLECLRTS